MPHFLNTKEHYFLSLNFKVMYTTMKRQANLKKVLWIRPLLSSNDKYFIVRNPYDRLESFYRDKLGKDLSLKRNWLSSQKIYFEPLGLTKASDEMKIQVIRDMTFEQFIRLLPLTYMKNRHLHPQYKIFTGLRAKRILKMESPADMRYLNEKLHLDMDIRANSTHQVDKNIHWDKDLADIVNRIYEKDFELYAYPFMETFD
jgi:hypothetical protein